MMTQSMAKHLAMISAPRARWRCPKRYLDDSVAMAVMLGLVCNVAAGAERNSDQHQALPAILPLASLDGSNGFRMDGVAVADFSGNAVAGIGDLNGDGIDDLLIGASQADVGGLDRVGSSYVVFGRGGIEQAAFPPAFSLASLDGSNGFRIDGVAEGDRSGRAVAGAGDINGDGINDLLIGAANADVGKLQNAGSAYLLFGRDTALQGDFPASLDLSTLNGSNGVRITGAQTDARTGIAVAALGDVNGDGLDDLLIGADLADPGDRPYAGISYVLFGRETAVAGNFAASISVNELVGRTGFRIHGAAAEHQSGRAVSGAGDVNGDGIQDMLIGAYAATANGVPLAGISYLVFGRDTLVAGDFPDQLELGQLNGSDGARLEGETFDEFSGFAVSGAGDINGDGLDDVIVGAYRADTIGAFLVGRSYVVFGRATAFPSRIPLARLNGKDGFRLVGAAELDGSGWSVSEAGDINGDGLDDLLVSAIGGDVGSNVNAGKVYVLFGTTAGFAAVNSLSGLTGDSGIRIDGAAFAERAGRQVSAAGDINGDGIDDIIIGADGAAPGGLAYAGSSYVVYGQAASVAPPPPPPPQALPAVAVPAFSNWGKLLLLLAMLLPLAWRAHMRAVLSAG